MLGDKFSPPALLPSAIAWFRAVAIGTTTGCPLVSERENWRAFLNVFKRHILDLVKYSVKLMFLCVCGFDRVDKALFLDSNHLSLAG